MKEEQFGFHFKKVDFTSRQLVKHIDSFGKGLNETEKKFIVGLIDDPYRVITKPMEAWIERIYNEKC